jgi:hypothetical protein
MNKSLVLISGLDHVVPIIAVDMGWSQVDLGSFRIRHLCTGLVRGGVQGCLDASPRCRRRVRHEIDEHLLAHQRTPTPVVGEMAAQPMCNRVPCAGPRWKMTHAHGQASRVAKPLARYVPQPGATAVAAPTLSGHQDVRRLGLPLVPQPLPPLRHGRHRKRCRVMLDAHADPATVGCHVLDARGTRCAPALLHNVMPPDPLRNPVGVILAATLGTIADQCFRFRSDGDARVPARLNVLDLGLDLCQLRVPVRRRRPLTGVPGPVPTGVEGLQPLANVAGAHRMALRAQRRGQTACTLPGPA